MLQIHIRPYPTEYDIYRLADEVKAKRTGVVEEVRGPFQLCRCGQRYKAPHVGDLGIDAIVRARSISYLN